MSDSESENTPKTQAAPAGGPPLPPKKTALGFDDEDSDPLEGLGPEERAELIENLRQFVETPNGASE